MKPTTIASLQKCKQDKKRFATITAYDYSFAKLFADEGLNVMLVGDPSRYRRGYRLPHCRRTSRRAKLPAVG